MQKHVKTNILSVLLVITVVSGALIGYYFGASGAYIGDVTEVWVQPPFHEASYVMGPYNSTHYYAQNCSTGNYDYQSTNSSYVWNSARTSFGTLSSGCAGSIFVKDGTYQVDSPWIVGKKTHLIADAEVTLNVTTSTNCIEIDSNAVEWTDFIIKNLYIDMNQQAGHGIYSSHVGYSNARCKGKIENIGIYDVASGKSGIELNNMFMLNGKRIRIYTYGTGMKITRSGGTMNYGNSYFEDMVIMPLGNNVVGLDVLGNGSSNRACNLCTFTRLQIGGVDKHGSGTIGIRITDDIMVTFNNVDLEGMTTNVYLDGCQRITFNDPFIHSTWNTTSYYGVHLVNLCRNNHFSGGYIGTDIGGRAYYDEGDATTWDNIIENIHIKGIWLLDQTQQDGFIIHQTT